jgi:hypothetical protein
MCTTVECMVSFSSENGSPYKSLYMTQNVDLINIYNFYLKCKYLMKQVCLFVYESCDSTVSIVLGYRLDNRGSRI